MHKLGGLLLRTAHGLSNAQPATSIDLPDL